MLCQVCKKNPASVHLTEISHFPVVDPSQEADPTDEEATPKYQEHHVCDACAQRSKVPFSAPTQSKGAQVWQMLKESARRARAEQSITCPECGMSLAEFRNTGRLGCPNDYEVFGEQIQPLLLRIHNATAHEGRVPGQDPEERERKRHLSQLREQLESAIREEAYESAARLRDEIQSLETTPGDEA